MKIGDLIITPAQKEPKQVKTTNWEAIEDKINRMQNPGTPRIKVKPPETIEFGFELKPPKDLHKFFRNVYSM